jgi:hypothetical protein
MINDERKKYGIMEYWNGGIMGWEQVHNPP